MNPSKLQPALLAGVAIGVLSALPVINMANLCCCAWVLFGGALASYLMQQNHPAPITAGDGAIVGLLAGVVGAVVGTLISIPLTIAMGPFQAELLERVLEGARDMPPEARNILEGMRVGPAIGIGLIFSFFAMLVAGCFFGLIGGLVGALLFKKNVPALPPPPPPVPTF
jgi:uncharacterized membrane protein YeaQ/YmgE (transglycosylase-associated protein family)